MPDLHLFKFERIRLMQRRALIIATRISTVLLALVLILAIASIWLNPRDHHLSLREDLHVGVWNHGLEVRIAFFNDSEYGPYRGSMIGIVDGQGNLYPPLERKRYFDMPGVYYRYFRWSDATLWTFMLSLWYPIVLFAILPTRRFVRWRRANSQ